MSGIITNQPANLFTPPNIGEHNTIKVVQTGTNTYDITGTDNRVLFRIFKVTNNKTGFKALLNFFIAQCSEEPEQIYEVRQLDGTTVYRIYKKISKCNCMRLNNWCIPCCGNKSVVNTYNGNTIGELNESCSCIRDNFQLISTEQNTRTNFIGPLSTTEWALCPRSYQWKHQQDKYDTITKYFTGYQREIYSNYDSYKLNFSSNLTPDEKILRVVLAMLIDLRCFEY